MTPRVYLSINFPVSEAVACTVAPPEQINSILPYKVFQYLLIYTQLGQFKPF